MPVFALPKRLMPTIGNKLAGKNNIKPAIDRAKIRSIFCLLSDIKTDTALIKIVSTRLYKSLQDYSKQTGVLITHVKHLDKVF